MSESEKQVIVIKNDTNYGIAGVIIGFVGIFIFSIVFQTFETVYKLGAR